ncbi:MAG: ribonuclease III [Patescibacteria group bacterium]
MDFSVFEHIIGVTFTDKALLRQAFVHRSFINENKGSQSEHNERLEFLGDAVLELISTVYLYKKYPQSNEGELTAYRSSLVNAINLADVAAKLQMEKFLLLSHGESKDKGKARQYILANTIEALIGAIYLDQGYEVTEKFLSKNVLYLIDDIVEKKAWIDAKSLFQEKAQEVDGVTPLYKVIREDGPDHDKSFTVGLFIRDKKIAQGEGKSKQEAEQEAAKEGVKVRGW